MYSTASKKKTFLVVLIDIYKHDLIPSITTVKRKNEKKKTRVQLRESKFILI